MTQNSGFRGMTINSNFGTFFHFFSHPCGFPTISFLFSVLDKFSPIINCSLYSVKQKRSQEFSTQSDGFRDITKNADLAAFFAFWVWKNDFSAITFLFSVSDKFTPNIIFLNNLCYKKDCDNFRLRTTVFKIMQEIQI